MEWEETQAITTEAPTQVDNVEDDLARELAFYNQVRGWGWRGWGGGVRSVCARSACVCVWDGWVWVCGGVQGTA